MTEVNGGARQALLCLLYEFLAQATNIIVILSASARDVSERQGLLCLLYEFLAQATKTIVIPSASACDVSARHPLITIGSLGKILNPSCLALGGG